MVEVLFASYIKVSSNKKSVMYQFCRTLFLLYNMLYNRMLLHPVITGCNEGSKGRYFLTFCV